MKKLLIVIILFIALKGNSQSSVVTADLIGKRLSNHVEQMQTTFPILQCLTVDTIRFKTKVSDTLFVTDEHIKFISIGGRVYEILPPTLKEVVPLSPWGSTLLGSGTLRFSDVQRSTQ